MSGELYLDSDYILLTMKIKQENQHEVTICMEKKQYKAVQ